MMLAVQLPTLARHGSISRLTLRGAMADRIVFVGETDEGVEVRVLWELSEPETVYVFMMTPERRSPAIECARVDL
jgi:hypothetical protein